MLLVYRWSSCVEWSACQQGECLTLQQVVERVRIVSMQQLLSVVKSHVLISSDGRRYSYRAAQIRLTSCFLVNAEGNDCHSWMVWCNSMKNWLSIEWLLISNVAWIIYSTNCVFMNSCKCLNEKKWAYSKKKTTRWIFVSKAQFIDHFQLQVKFSNPRLERETLEQ